MWGRRVLEHRPRPVHLHVIRRGSQYSVKNPVAFFQGIPHWQKSLLECRTPGSAKHRRMAGIAHAQEVHGFSKIPGTRACLQARMSLHTKARSRLPRSTFSASPGRRSGKPARLAASRKAGGPPGMFRALENDPHGNPARIYLTQPAWTQPSTQRCSLTLPRSWWSPKRQSTDRTHSPARAAAFDHRQLPANSSTTIVTGMRR